MSDAELQLAGDFRRAKAHAAQLDDLWAAAETARAELRWEPAIAEYVRFVARADESLTQLKAVRATGPTIPSARRWISQAEELYEQIGTRRQAAQQAHDYCLAERTRARKALADAQEQLDLARANPGAAARAQELAAMARELDPTLQGPALEIEHLAIALKPTTPPLANLIVTLLLAALVVLALFAFVALLGRGVTLVSL
jgi:hypothetical protein